MALFLFLLVFALLQWGWSSVRGTWIERLVIHEATVKPAAALIHLLTPEIPARAAGASIKAPGGGLNILNGCEGTEVMFLLAAAFVAVRLPWRRRIWGLILGLTLIFALNQARILALFYAFRTDRALFDTLHTAILPVVLVALTAAYFHAALSAGRPRPV
jgi:exosortase/archaeosortase family protein